MAPQHVQTVCRHKYTNQEVHVQAAPFAAMLSFTTPHRAPLTAPFTAQDVGRSGNGQGPGSPCLSRQSVTRSGECSMTDRVGNHSLQ